MEESFYEAIMMNLAGWAESAGQWFDRNFQDIVQILFVVILSALLSKHIQKLLRGFLRHALVRDRFPSNADREKRINTLAGMGTALIRLIIWLTAGVTVITITGINVAPIMASAGVVGLAIGFGAQKLINDLVSGIFIIFENQYRIGDYIEVEGVTGTVEEISIRTTVLRDLSGAVHHVPNGMIGVSTNRSMGYGQLNLDIIVEPGTDLVKLQKIINRVGERIATEADIKDAIIEAPRYERLTDFTGSGITVKVIGKTTGGKQLEIKSIFFTELKAALDKQHIKLAALPFAAKPLK